MNSGGRSTVASLPFTEEDDMEGKTPEHAQEKRIRQSLLCRWLRKGSAVLWGLLIPCLLLSILAALLFFRWPWSSNPKIAEEGSAVR